MRKKHINLIAALLIVTCLVGGLGWTVYAPIHQDKLNRALIAAIKSNDTQKALTLLSEGADANSRDEPPQHFSLWRLILDRLRGNQPAPSTAPTALLVACSRDDETGSDTKSPANPLLIRALLDRGAATEVKDEDRCTPLIHAVSDDNTQVSTLLIERGANVNSSETKGFTPLILAANNNNKALVRLLLNKGANVNAIVDAGWMPLTEAQLDEEHDDPTITEMLLSRGAKINGPDVPIEGWQYTPLTAAIKSDRPKTVHVLIQHGADVNLKPSDGFTPLQWAKERRNPTIIQMLKQAGAKE